MTHSITALKAIGVTSLLHYTLAKAASGAWDVTAVALAAAALIALT